MIIPNANFLSIFIKVLLFLILAVAMYVLVKAVRQYGPLKKIRDKIDDMDRQRILDTEVRKKNFLEKHLDRLDEQLVQAGIKRFLPKAGVEMYFLVNVLEFTSIFCLAGDGIFVPLLTAGIAVYANKLALDMLRYRNKRITEKHLLEFLNLISDYSISENEITMILYKCGQVMPNPLKSVLIQCHLSARSTGNTKQALYELRRSIDHFLFREIMLLLELCSRSDNDYQKVIQECREMVNRYLKEEKEKTAVVRSLIGEAAIMTAVAAYGISTMLREFAGEAGFGTSMTAFFFYHPAGQICLILYIGLFFAMIQVILKFAKR